MPKILSTSLSNRRLLPALALVALLASLLLIQLRGFAASPKSVLISPCTAANVSGGTSPQQPGDGTITISASSTGCTTPEYKYLLLPPGTSTWLTKTAYTTSTTYTWVTAGQKEGMWQIGVWAREVGTAVKYQAYAIISFTLITTYCTSSTITPSVPSPQPATTVVTFTATANLCFGAVWETWELLPGSSTWVMKQPYLTHNFGGDTYTWDTTDLAPGAYRWAFWAKQGTSKHTYDSYAMLTFWVS